MTLLRIEGTRLSPVYAHIKVNILSTHIWYDGNKWEISPVWLIHPPTPLHLLLHKLETNSILFQYDLVCESPR